MELIKIGKLHKQAASLFKLQDLKPGGKVTVYSPKFTVIPISVFKLLVE